MTLLKENALLRAELEYFVARVEGRHPDGKISSKKTYGRFKQLLVALDAKPVGQVGEAIAYARKYPAQYRTWLRTMTSEVSNDFLVQLLKDTENTNLSADWLIYLADLPAITKGEGDEKVHV